MQIRAFVTLSVALVLAGISVALAHAWLSAEAGRSAPAEENGKAAPQLATVPLAVASRTLSYGERLRPADVKLVDWPKTAVPAGALHVLDRLIKTPDMPAPVVLRPIAANEPILTDKISGFGPPARLAATIGPGMRAVVVKLGGPPGLARLIGPGDRVDVLIAREGSQGARDRDLRAAVLLQDVRVLGLEPATGGQGGASGARSRAVTLEVTMEQAHRLALAHKIGTLSLALRGLDGAAPGREFRTVSSRDLPAGPERDAEVLAGAAWEAKDRGVLAAASVAAEQAADNLTSPSRPAVRIIRGLEASEYEVAPEASQ